MKDTKFIEKTVLLQAITALRQLNEKRYSDSSNKKPLLDDVKDPVLYLQVSLKKIPDRKGIKMIKVYLPHRLLKDNSEVCLIMGDLDRKNRKADITSDVMHYKELLRNQGIGCITEVITLRQLRTEYRPFEAKQKLLAAFDMFLVDKKIAECLPRLLGRHSFKKRKFPIQIDMNSPNLKQQVENCLSAKVFYITGHGNSCTSEVAYLNMSDSDICDNITAMSNRLAGEMPGTWDNVMGVYLKTSLSKGMPLYISYDDPSKVLLRSEEDKDVPIIDELSTYNNLDVKVYQSGKIGLQKRKAEVLDSYCKRRPSENPDSDQEESGAISGGYDVGLKEAKEIQEFDGENEEMDLNTDDSLVGQAIANSKASKLSKKQKVSDTNEEINSRGDNNSMSETVQSLKARKKLKKKQKREAIQSLKATKKKREIQEFDGENTEGNLPMESEKSDEGVLKKFISIMNESTDEASFLSNKPLEKKSVKNIRKKQKKNRKNIIAEDEPSFVFNNNLPKHSVKDKMVKSEKRNKQKKNLKPKDTKWFDSEWLDADGLKMESSSESPVKELEKSFVENEEVSFVSSESSINETARDEKDTLKLEDTEERLAMELETSNQKRVETSVNHVTCEEVAIILDNTSESDAVMEFEKSDEMMESEKSDEMIESEKSNEMVESEKSDQMIESEKSNEMVESEKSDQMIESEKSNEMVESEKSDQMIESEKRGIDVLDSESLITDGMDADGLAMQFYSEWLSKQSKESIVKNENVLSDSNESNDTDSAEDEKDLKLKDTEERLAMEILAGNQMPVKTSEPLVKCEEVSFVLDSSNNSHAVIDEMVKSEKIVNDNPQETKKSNKKKKKECKSKLKPQDISENIAMERIDKSSPRHLVKHKTRDLKFERALQEIEQDMRKGKKSKSSVAEDVTKDDVYIPKTAEVLLKEANERLVIMLEDIYEKAKRLHNQNQNRVEPKEVSNESKCGHGRCAILKELCEYINAFQKPVLQFTIQMDHNICLRVDSKHYNKALSDEEILKREEKKNMETNLEFFNSDATIKDCEGVDKIIEVTFTPYIHGYKPIPCSYSMEDFLKGLREGKITMCQYDVLRIEVDQTDFPRQNKRSFKSDEENSNMDLKEEEESQSDTKSHNSGPSEVSQVPRHRKKEERIDKYKEPTALLTFGMIQRLNLNVKKMEHNYKIARNVIVVDEKNCDIAL